MRHADILPANPIHVTAYNYLIYTLPKVCIHLNFDYERLQYGFLCQCGKDTENHIAVLPETPSTTTVYAECSVNSVYRMKLNPLQSLWFLYEQQPTVKNGDFKCYYCT